jgi:DNA-directed RNA polymerase specialized sigma subunit
MGTLTPADTQTSLFDAWKQAPGPKTLTPLIQNLEPTITKALTAYGYAGDANMRTQARLLAANALPRFDPKRASLDTFVFGELRRLQRIGPKQEHAVPIPERVMLERRALERASSDLYEELGRPPTDDEIQDRTGLTKGRLRTLRSVRAQVVGENLDDQGRVITAADDGTDASKLWEEAVVYSLGPVDKKIYEWSTGSGGEQLTKAEMALRLRISPAAVTQRAAMIARKLSAGEAIRV